MMFKTLEKEMHIMILHTALNILKNTFINCAAKTCLICCEYTLKTEEVLYALRNGGKDAKGGHKQVLNTIV